MRYQLAGFEIDTVNRLVTKADHLLPVEPQVFNLLVFFCEHPLQVIDVSDISLTFYHQKKAPAALIADIAKLHFLLEENPKKPKLLECIGYKQYRLLEKPQEKISLSFPSTSTQTPAQNKRSTSHKQTPNYQVKKRSNRKIWLWALTSISIFAICATLLSWHQENSKEAITTLAKQEQPIIKLDGASYAPKLSSKNGRFVFLHKTPNADNSQVYLGHIDNSPAKALTDDGFYYMDAIIANNAVYATRFNNLSERKCDIVKIALTGNKTDVIKACSAHALTKLDYSPNTEALFFNLREEQDQPYTIYSYSLETGQTNPVTQESHNKQSYGDYLFNYNVHNNQLAVMEHLVDGSSLLKVIDLADNRKTEFDKFQSPSGISWLDTDQLMISDDSGVNLYDLTKKQKRVISDDGNITQLSSVAHDNQFAFVENQYQVNLHQYDLTLQTLALPTAVTESDAMNYKPVFANTSSSILFLAKKHQNESLFIKNNQGQLFDLGIPEPIEFYTNFVWAPDDSAILASVNGKLFIKSLQQKHWQQLHTEHDQIHHVQYTANSEFVFSSKKSGDWQLWQGNTDGLPAKQLTKSGGYSSQYDKVNNHIYFTKFHIDGLYLLDQARNVEQKVDANFPLNLWAHWQIRNQNLYVQRNRAIEKIALSSFAVVDLYDLSNIVANYFSISRNEHLLVVDKIERSETYIWLGDVITQ